MHNALTSFLIIGIALSGFVTPLLTHAMSIYVEMPEKALRVGNTTFLDVMVDTEDTEINAIEGTVTFEDPRFITTISTGGSIFTLWPRRPSVDADRISFTGGTISGVFGNALKLFTIVVTPTTQDLVSINFGGVTAYLNDGKGTPVSLSGSSLEIPVFPIGNSENELATQISTDITPPQEFLVELGRDPSVYDGKYFISFFASDSESGINRYEVIENDYPMVRSGNAYVLQDQSLHGTVEVRAVDNAGNTLSKTLALQDTEEIAPSSYAIVLIIILGALIVGCIFYIRYIRRKK